jgi:hypothetical protein
MRGNCAYTKPLSVIKKEKMKITIDTCLINARKKDSILNRLEELHEKGKIEIIGTERLLQETENNKSRKDKAESYENISEPITIGFWKVGRGYISDGKGPKFKELAQILFPEKDISQLSENESNDVMHLISHSKSNSDYFITNNKWDFIHARKNNKNRDGSYENVKRKQLEKIGIRVLTPDEVLKILEDKK